MLVQNFDIETNRLFTGKGVHVAADRVQLASDIFGAAMSGALEHHVLDKMRDAVDGGIFVARAGLYPDPHRDRTDVVHVFGQDGEPVGQHLASYIADLFNHYLVTAPYTLLLHPTQGHQAKISHSLVMNRRLAKIPAASSGL